jgi:hypothetical protein
MKRHALALIACLLVAACASDTQVHDAINDVNAEFRVEYERGLAKNGTHVYPVPRARAYDAVLAALTRIGFHIGDQSEVLGYLALVAPAPLPLTREEWNRAAEADLPRLREIARKHVGFVANFINFEPEGLEVIINATVIGTGSSSEISLTMRMREYAPPKSGVPRREYPPPTAVHMGLEKMWREVDRDLTGTQGR